MALLYYKTGRDTTGKESIVTILKEVPMRELKRRKLEKEFAWIDQSYRDDPEEWSTGPTPDEVKEAYEAKALDVGLELVVLKDFLNRERHWDFSHEDLDSLRAEIIQDIVPIVTPSNDAEAFAALKKLVDKINAMNIHPPWCVGVADKRSAEEPFLVREGPFKGEPLVGFTLPTSAGPGMRIAGKKFSIYHVGLDTNYPVNKKDFYSVIIKTLEDSSFQKLKRCTECSRFFIADRLSDKFCRPECSKAYFDRSAVDRVRKSRAKPQIEEKRQVGKKQHKKRRPLATVKGNRRRHGPNVKVERKPRKQSKT
jgi:hypothetical protein